MLDQFYKGPVNYMHNHVDRLFYKTQFLDPLMLNNYIYQT